MDQLIKNDPSEESRESNFQSTDTPHKSFDVFLTFNTLKEITKCFRKVRKNIIRKLIASAFTHAKCLKLIRQLRIKKNLPEQFATFIDL